MHSAQGDWKVVMAMREPDEEEVLRLAQDLGGSSFRLEERSERRKEPELARAQHEGFLRVTDSTSVLTSMAWKQWCAQHGAPDLRILYREKLLQHGRPDEWDVSVELPQPTSEAVVRLVQEAVGRYQGYRPSSRRRAPQPRTILSPDLMLVEGFLKEGAAEGLAHEILVLLENTA